MVSQCLQLGHEYIHELYNEWMLYTYIYVRTFSTAAFMDLELGNEVSFLNELPH